VDHNHGENRTQCQRYGRRSIASIRFANVAEERLLRGDFIAIVSILTMPLILPPLGLALLALVPLLGAGDSELGPQDVAGIGVPGIQLAKARRYYFSSLSCGK